MSAILSVFNRNGEAVDQQIVESMMAASPDRAVDGQQTWIAGPVAVAHQHFWITPEELGERQPLLDAGGCRTIAADARLDNRGELFKLLDLEDLNKKEISDAALILLSYQRWGTACAERLLGDFAFVIWDADEQQLFAARDVLGVRGLCFYVDNGCCLIGSEVAQFLAHPAVERRVDEGKIADYLAGILRNEEDSFYEDIKYCPPATCMTISSESFRKWRYWDVDPQKQIRYKNDHDYSAHFLELLTETVACRMRSIGAVGISLSGGLDSTSLAAIAASLLPRETLPQERLKSFSYVFDELSSCDERQYIQPVVDRYNLDATYILCDDKWTLRDSQDWPVNASFVLSDPYAWLPLAVMKAAREEGCRLLMAGYYGDVLFTGGRSWAAGMMADLRIGQLAKTVVQQRDMVELRRDILNNGLRHMIPHWIRMPYGRYQAKRVTTIHAGIHPKLAESILLGNRHFGEEERRTSFGPDQWHRYLSLSINVFSQGASTVRSQYNRYGLELATPYWDRRLVEYVLALPADQLGRPQRDRWLMRNAVSDLLPGAVCERRERTIFSPLMEKGIFEKEQDAVERIMNDPLIAKMQFVREDWLQQQMAGGRGWLDDGQRYFLWKCLSLELWLTLLFSPRPIYFTQEDPYE